MPLRCQPDRLPRLRLVPFLRAAALAATIAAAGPLALAQSAPAAPASAVLPSTALPPSVEAALARAKVPRDAVAFFVADAEGRQPPRLAWRAQELVNPASVMKLVTTYAGLDLLGPAYTWSTPVYADGAVVDGTLQGNLYLRGQGDPTMVVERLWLLLRRVQALGIRRIAGDVVVDRSAFDAGVESDPAAFDGEPLRPYNASPDAFLVNFRSVTLDFTPEVGGRFALVSAEPPLAGVSFPARVPLGAGECGDWRAALQADFADPAQPRFAGALPAACGARSWPVAWPDPQRFGLRAIGGLWQQMGGQIDGQLRLGTVPTGARLLFEAASPPLGQVVRDINKYSNNVMTQQLFLTLGLTQRQRGSFDAARAAVRQWWASRVGGTEPAPVMVNGAGLSREDRLTAAGLARMLQVAWRSPVMPELIASLPVMGVDGTLRNRPATTSAHLKTGSLRDVAAIAGYVDGVGGRRWVVVAIANDPAAGAARPAFDALVEWVSRQN